ncbi:MAG: hypothetical protein ACRC2K_13390 [Clostridium sp.]
MKINVLKAKFSKHFELIGGVEKLTYLPFKEYCDFVDFYRDNDQLITEQRVEMLLPLDEFDGEFGYLDYVSYYDQYGEVQHRYFCYTCNPF